MISGTSKRLLSDSTSPAHPERINKRLDLKSTPKSRLQSPQTSVKPIYPSNQERRDLVNVVDHFTKLALEPNLERIQKPVEQSEGETLVAKIELQKLEIINGLDVLITDLLIRESGKNDEIDLNAVKAEAKEFTADKLANILGPDGVDQTKQLLAKMADYASQRLLVELKASNLVPSSSDSSTTVKEKKSLLRLTNPYRAMITNIVDDMLVQGVLNRPSIVRGAGLMAALSDNYHNIQNSMAESEKRLDLMTNQIGNLTQSVTDQDNGESHRMLVIRGISDVILTKESPESHIRAKREVEAAVYIRETIGFTGSFTVSMPPSRNRGSGIAILTTAFEQDKFRLERMISNARKGHSTTISSKRWTPADKAYSNLPNPENLARNLKIGMKNTFADQLSKLKAEPDVKKHELAALMEKTWGPAIHSHDYHPRKVLYGKENSVQYEFLCPVSKGIMMIYKGDNTFEGYDFTHTYPNPKLREMSKGNKDLADKHSLTE